jgi:4-aminobutyrate aminotransferase-like enzyme
LRRQQYLTFKLAPIADEIQSGKGRFGNGAQSAGALLARNS